MTTGGEGGMVTSNDEGLWRAMWAFKDHGKSFDAVYAREHPAGYRWLHESFGTNWRMIEIQAVIGRIQLRRMTQWHEQRARNADAILKACQRHASVRVPSLSCNSNESTAQCSAACGCTHGNYKCYVYVRPDHLGEGWTRDRIVDAINADGVPCYQGSCSEVYLEKAFDNTGWRPPERLPVARELGETSLMFLVHPTLTPAEIEKTCSVITAVLGAASR